MFIHFETKKNNEKQEQIKINNIRDQRIVHKSPHMKGPRSNRTENNKENTAEECGILFCGNQFSIREDD